MLRNGARTRAPGEKLPAGEEETLHVYLIGISKEPCKANDAALAGVQRGKGFAEETMTLYSHVGNPGVKGSESCDKGSYS